MKLNKEEIQYIDAYLERSGVTYWDVRMELLDHFIIAIEEKIQTNETSFEEALLEVTTAFGNSVHERHLVTKDKTKVLFSGMFSNNKGFKELEDKKRKQIRRQYLKSYWTQFQRNFSSQKFYMDYLFFIMLLYVLVQFFTDWFAMIAIVWICAEIVKTVFTTSNFKAVSSSLHVDISTKILTILLVVTINSHTFIRMYGEAEQIPLIAGIILFLYPIVKTSIYVHKSIYAKYEKYHELISA